MTDPSVIDHDLCKDFGKEDIEALQSLYNAVRSLDNVDDLHRFFTDLCSANELRSMLHRWQILLLIDEGKNYEEIISELAPSEGKGYTTKVSSTTISRVKACYNNPDGGYRKALGKMKNKEK